MTPRSLEGISSGMHYPVTHLDGRRPADAADFVGEAAFLIHQADRSMPIDGVGRLDTFGTGVHFRQKDPQHGGRDVRVWHLRSLPDQQLIAEHIAAI